MIVSYGTNKKLNFYEYNDNDINKKYSNNNFKDEIDNIEEYKKDKDINQQDFFLIIYTKKKINKIDLKNNNMSIIYTNEKNANFLCKINKNSFLLCQEKKLVILCSFQKGIGSTIEEILDGYYKNGIVIDETLIIATSNSVISGGKDIIIFYNTKNKIIKEIEGYSFILSHTCLYLMEINNNQVLLCACKKYKNTQKNGILLINNLKSIKFNNFEDKINIKFYDTNNFEVHCFCQISTLNNINNKRIINNSNFLIKSNYFFVGGFDTDKGKGCLKLYKFDDEKFEIKEIVNNVKIKDFEGFNGTIRNIIQLSKNGKILITCWDGNNYLFTNPHLNEHLFEII